MSGAMRSCRISIGNTAQKRTALAAAVISYRGRSALREVAKAMGLSDDVRSALSGSIWGWWSSTLGETEAKAGGLDQADPLSRHIIDRANEIMGFPRHLSQHVGGFVITKDRLDEIVPIIKTAMDERKMVEWDKDDLDPCRHPQGRYSGARHAVLPAPRLRSSHRALRRQERERAAHRRLGHDDQGRQARL